MSRKRRHRDVSSPRRESLRNVAHDYFDARSLHARRVADSREVRPAVKRAALRLPVRRLVRAPLRRLRTPKHLSVSLNFAKSMAHHRDRREVVGCVKSKLEDFKDRQPRSKRAGGSRSISRRGIFQAARRSC